MATAPCSNCCFGHGLGELHDRGMSHQVVNASHRTQILIAVISALGGVLVAAIGLFGTLAATDKTITSTSPSAGATVTVTAAAPTVTRDVPGPTVTVTESSTTGGSEATTAPDTIHLADSSEESRDLLIDSGLDEASNLDIDGKSYDFAWEWCAATYNSTHVVVGINSNQRFSTFHTQIGLSGDSKNNSGKIGIILDGQEVKTYAVRGRFPAASAHTGAESDW